MFVVQGGAVRVGGGDDDGEDDTKEDVDPNAPRVYANGMPLRPRKKTSVCDVVVTLGDHGLVEPAPLSDAQRRLLGR